MYNMQEWAYNIVAFGLCDVIQQNPQGTIWNALSRQVGTIVVNTRIKIVWTYHLDLPIFPSASGPAWGCLGLPSVSGIKDEYGLVPLDMIFA